MRVVAISASRSPGPDRGRLVREAEASLRPGRREQTDLRTELCLLSRSSSATLTVSDGAYPPRPSLETRDPRETLPAGSGGEGRKKS